MIRYFSLLLFSFFSLLSIGQEKDLYSIESTKKFANYLFGSGNYEQAAIEYERLILLDSANSDSFKHRALISYRKAGLLTTSLDRIRTWHGVNDWREVEVGESQYKSPFSKEYALCFTGMGYYREAIDFLKINEHNSAKDKNLLLAINYCYLGEWNNAQSSIDLVNENSLAKQILEKAILDGLKLKLKKPGLAATLAIVPGLGRLYTGNYADAGLSAVVIGTFGWQAYTGFDRNGIRSAYGWLTGSVATGFYFGNIYGSYRAAELINKQRIEAILYEVERAYSLID